MPAATYPYLVRADLQSRVGGAALYLQLIDDNNAGSIDSTAAAVETMILNGVAGMTEGYVLRAGGAAPLDTADFAFLKRLMLDVANYDLKARRGKASEDDRIKYQDAVTYLQGLAGSVLPSNSGGDTTTANLEFTGYEQEMNRSRLRFL